MADGQQPKGAGKQVPYPKNWGRMTAGQKREWLAKNRPNDPPPPRFVPPAQRGQEQQQPAKSAPVEQQTSEEDRPENAYPESEQEQSEEPGGLTVTISAEQLSQIDGNALVASLLRGIADSLSPDTEYQ